MWMLHFLKGRQMFSNLCNTSYKYMSSHKVEKRRTKKGIPLSVRENETNGCMWLNILSAQCVKQQFGNTGRLHFAFNKGKEN